MMALFLSQFLGGFFAVALVMCKFAPGDFKSPPGAVALVAFTLGALLAGQWYLGVK